MNGNKKWDDEPTPLCEKAAYDMGDYGREPRTDGDHVEFDFAADLERRLRHAWKLVNSLRIDAMHDEREESNRSYMDIDEMEQRLADIEEVLAQ